MTLVRRAPGPVLASAPPLAGSEAVAAVELTFSELYEEYFAFVWRNARRLGTPEGDMDDVAQEIFVVAYRRLTDFEGRSSLRTWLLGIVINVVRAHRRVLFAKHPHALRAETREEPETVPDEADDPQESASKAQAARVLDRLLDEIDDPKREAFVLAELEQMTAPEIATTLGVPLNTVYSRLRAARQDFAKLAARHRAREQAGEHWRKP